MSEVKQLSIIIPAFNEAEGVSAVVKEYLGILKKLGMDGEVIVVDDGSSDDTFKIAKAAGATVLRNPSNKGYGYSLMKGIEIAKYPRVMITDADGTYPSEAVPLLVEKCGDFDMVVGQRTGKYYKGNFAKRLSRPFFRFLVEYTTGTPIPDINSGLRIFPRDFVLKHRSSISTGYSFTTTITLIALLEGLHLCYIPIDYRKRAGSSKVRWVRDTLRAVQIITETILIYNPLKLFLLLAGAIVALIVPVLMALVLAKFCLIPWTLKMIIAYICFTLQLAVMVFSLGCVAHILSASFRRNR